MIVCVWRAYELEVLFLLNIVKIYSYTYGIESKAGVCKILFTHLGIFKLPFFLSKNQKKKKERKKAAYMIDMESANLHQQQQLQLQDQLVGSPSSSSSTPSYCYGVATSHAWTPTPNVTLNPGDLSPTYNGVILNSRQKHESSSVQPPNNHMIQTPAGLHWTNNEGSFGNQFTHDHYIHLGRIKEEFSESFPKFTEMLNSSSGFDQDSHLHPKVYLKCDEDDDEKRDLNDLSEKLLLKTISSGFPINVNQFSASEFYSTGHNVSSFGNSIPNRGNFSQIYPSINVSSLNQSSSATSSSNSFAQALDLLTSSSRFNGNFSHHHSHEHSLAIYKEGLPFGLDQNLQQSSHQRPPFTPCKMSSFSSNEITEAKRPSGSMEPKATPKKSRVESRASCPPFKVRKEKLGDRIAALQQLVAPFGKTDTASVLMEAIGYIKFLQNQVETLSVPYMKASRNKTSRSMRGGSVAEEENEAKRDLRSRGLCLVPLSCMSYVTNDVGGGAFWPPPNFGGGT